MRGLAYYSRLLGWGIHHYLPEHDVTIDTANGLLSVSSKDWLVGKQLFVSRRYELEFIDITIEFLREIGHLHGGKNQTVVDIGANLGMIGIALLRRNYFENALAFEPGPRNFELLTKNVAQNRLSSRVKCFQLALSSSDDHHTEFEICADNSGDNRVRRTTEMGDLNEQSRRTVKVEASTFDSFLDKTGEASEVIDLLWMDIQGHEGHFFSGAREFFGRRRVPVVNEFWGYGIGRSGMSRDQYCTLVTQTFSELYLFTEHGYEPRPILDIDSFFDKFSRPREIANVILI